MRVYGADKVWRQLNREGIPVARCTVERLKRLRRLRGVVRGKVVRTTSSNTRAPCPLDRANRQFNAADPIGIRWRRSAALSTGAISWRPVRRARNY
ncbi:IS3 family transposase (plasmid) [Cupriavidus sp. KK10]|jgi:transposase InsO family protein|nr:IS3 family transposase [Cupriavidus sp. KK10]